MRNSTRRTRCTRIVAHDVVGFGKEEVIQQKQLSRIRLNQEERGNYYNFFFFYYRVAICYVYLSQDERAYIEFAWNFCPFRGTQDRQMICTACNYSVINKIWR